jgi:hypothetical protein
MLLLSTAMTTRPPMYAERMPYRLVFPVQVLVFLGFASTLFGQIDTSQLRAKFGPPQYREIFTVAQGFQVIVDYGADREVCRMELPALAPSWERPGVNDQKTVDDLLLQLVPPSMRGKNLRTMVFTSGPNFLETTEYEHVSISEPGNASGRTGVIVQFKRDDCGLPAAR